MSQHYRYIDSKISGRYKAGYQMGFYEDIYYDSINAGNMSSTYHWHKEKDLIADEEFQMGLQDGRGDRAEKGLPSKEGDFFAFNMSGTPWGTSIEKKVRERGFIFEWCDGAGNPDNESPEFFRLKKKQQ